MTGYDVIKKGHFSKDPRNSHNLKTVCSIAIMPILDMKYIRYRYHSIGNFISNPVKLKFLEFEFNAYAKIKKYCHCERVFDKSLTASG